MVPDTEICPADQRFSYREPSAVGVFGKLTVVSVHCVSAKLTRTTGVSPINGIIARAKRKNYRKKFEKVPKRFTEG
jgi:hypothetical protein